MRMILTTLLLILSIHFEVVGQQYTLTYKESIAKIREYVSKTGKDSLNKNCPLLIAEMSNSSVQNSIFCLKISYATFDQLDKLITGNNMLFNGGIIEGRILIIKEKSYFSTFIDNALVCAEIVRKNGYKNEYKKYVEMSKLRDTKKYYEKYGGISHEKNRNHIMIYYDSNCKIISVDTINMNKIKFRMVNPKGEIIGEDSTNDRRYIFH